MTDHVRKEVIGFSGQLATDKNRKMAWLEQEI
jgi:hypothetical protein